LIGLPNPFDAFTTYWVALVTPTGFDSDHTKHGAITIVVYVFERNNCPSGDGRSPAGVWMTIPHPLQLLL
jgi:hypothetical protein